MVAKKCLMSKHCFYSVGMLIATLVVYSLSNGWSNGFPSPYFLGGDTGFFKGNHERKIELT